MYTFIVNPNAKTGLGYQVWSSLEAILKEKSVNYHNVVNLRRNICSENILHIFLLFSIQTIVYIV